ncbi:hypothetical protein HWV62_44659 [Athelia sp. TMB]|nr:hypothetical protein HWV62_44659 [Athelia sp. TMB]
MDDSGGSGHGHQPAPYEVRVTTHGKMHGWVEFSLKHLQDSDIPLRLHTLPAPSHKEKPSGHDAPADLVPETKDRMPDSTTTIPRLISVVEIIKREYLKTLSLKESRSLTGLHQYNEIGVLDSSTAPEDRDQMVAQALAGTSL